MAEAKVTHSIIGLDSAFLAAKQQAKASTASEIKNMIERLAAQFSEANPGA